MRLVVYTDYVYRRTGETVYAERAFALFQVALRRHASVTVIGRLDPNEGPARYPLPDDVRFVPLPHFPSMTRAWAVLSSLLRSLRIAWRTVPDADCVWVLGPSPHGLALALIGLVRRRRVVLGVRQDYPTYIRSRRPNARWMHLAADVLEAAWRALARRCPVIVVGPELARHYAHAPELLPITVSLITERDVELGRQAAARSYDGAAPRQVLTVGRVDREKNPLLLADVLALLRREHGDWRLLVCGEGPLRDRLAERLSELGLSDHAELTGYLALDAGLLELYRQSHVFLHVSLTEGMPQVLIESFASGLPVVATAVGGVAEAAGEAALLIPPEDAVAAARAVAQVAEDQQQRERLIAAGLKHAAAHTLEREIERVAAFLAAPVHA